MQIALQPFGGGQAFQNAFFLRGVKRRLGANGLQLLLPPALLRLVRDVHVLGANGAAVGFAQGVEQLAQRHGVFAEEGVAHVEHRFHVRVRKAVERRLQLRNNGPLGALERIQIGPALAHVAVGGDELLHRRALAPQVGVVAKGAHHLRAAVLGALGKGVNHGLVRHIAGAAAIRGGHVLQGVEIFAPGIGHAAGVFQVFLVHLFDVRGVASEKVGIALVSVVDGFRLAHRSLTFRLS